MEELGRGSEKVETVVTAWGGLGDKGVEVAVVLRSVGDGMAELG